MACVPATSSPATSVNRARPRLASSGLRAPKLERQTCHFYVMPLELSLVSHAALVWELRRAILDMASGVKLQPRLTLENRMFPPIASMNLLHRPLSHFIATKPDANHRAETSIQSTANRLS